MTTDEFERIQDQLEASLHNLNWMIDSDPYHAHNGVHHICELLGIITPGAAQAHREELIRRAHAKTVRY